MPNTEKHTKTDGLQPAPSHHEHKAVNMRAEPPAHGDSQPNESNQPNNRWDRFLDDIRLATPATIVNEGGRINFGLRAIADSLSIKSGLRPAILNDEQLHRPFFEANPGKLPKGFEKFEKGMHLGFAAPHRAAGSALTLAGLLMGAYYGEKPISEEEKQAQSELPVGEFIKKRLSDSLHPSQHATATAGMLTIANGALFTVSGLKQFNGFQRGMNRKEVWKAIPWESVQGLMTMFAGGCLQFIPNQERAWQISTSVFLYRAPVAATQAARAWNDGIPGKVDPGDWEQGAKWILNQTSNAFGILYGGVKKEDGKIIRVKSNEADDINIITSNAAANEQGDGHDSIKLEKTSETPTPTISNAEIAAERVEGNEATRAAG